MPHADRFYRTLLDVEADLPVAEFLQTDCAIAIRRAAALGDTNRRGLRRRRPERFSTLALREEWLGRDDGEHGRIREGYGALTPHLKPMPPIRGAAIRLGAVVTAIEEAEGGLAARCADGAGVAADAASSPCRCRCCRDCASANRRASGRGRRADIGFGNVVKILLRFATPWWVDSAGQNLADFRSCWRTRRSRPGGRNIPTQSGADSRWYAGPKADTVAALGENELVAMGLPRSRRFSIVPADRLRGRRSLRHGRSTGERSVRARRLLLHHAENPRRGAAGIEPAG